jgi:hypothetical protein
LKTLNNPLQKCVDVHHHQNWLKKVSVIQIRIKTFKVHVFLHKVRDPLWILIMLCSKVHPQPQYSEPVFVNLLMSPAWRAGTTTLFVVPALKQATWACEIVTLESIPVLLKRLKIRAPFTVCL